MELLAKIVNCIQVVFISQMPANLENLRGDYQKLQAPLKKSTAGQNVLSYMGPLLWYKGLSPNFASNVKRV